MKTELLILCPKCSEHLISKTVGWHNKPTCENCLTSFEITIVADDMKMIFEEVEYLK